jgi:hypothetical protein
MYKITVYIPIEHLEPVKQAMFAQGAGRIGNYKCCCWQVLGQGQFLPLANSQPTFGQPGTLETVAEYLVEMVCEDDCLNAVIRALIAAHPYEEPAYSVYRVETVTIAD